MCPLAVPEETLGFWPDSSLDKCRQKGEREREKVGAEIKRRQRGEVQRPWLS